MSLREYQRKRDFTRTAEPLARRGPGSQQRFVIQKHEASRLHYDLRLEMNGTLKSWAVPKGIPLRHGERRLAVEVEDHPVSYLDFEGTIPRGQYGGGTVMVWDFGTYEMTQPFRRSPDKLQLNLHGHKVQGAWHLVRMRTGTGWLLIKGGTDLPPLTPGQEDRSALSGRSMSQIEAQRPVRDSSIPRGKSSRPRVPPPFFAPMLAKPVTELPTGAVWQFEVKFDGYRALLLRDQGQLHLISRQQQALGPKFPEILESAEQITPGDYVMDGELVALDAEGRSSFQLLQNGERGNPPPTLRYYAFDLLQRDDRDLRRLPLEERRMLLEGLISPKLESIRFSPTLTGSPPLLLKRVRELGLEGLVGKRRGSRYEPGKRSGAWIKYKLHQEGDFVIGGFTRPQGTRRHLGALLLGFYRGKQLCYAGKVGTGFTEGSLRSLHQDLVTRSKVQCPFANLPEDSLGRFGSGLTRAAMKECQWVKPELVCRVRYTEITRDGKLRHPVFLGLRPELNSKSVTVADHTKANPTRAHRKPQRPPAA